MHTLVTGIGRCGLSLMVQMLDAGGFPVHGSFPDYEVFDVGTPVPDILPQVGESAVKLVDPAQYPFPGPRRFECRAILLERDPLEQARSQMKFLKAITTDPIRIRDFAESNPTALQNLATANRVDTRKNRGRLANWTRARTLRLNFAELIAFPVEVASAVAHFLEAPLDVERMALQVRKRDAACYEGMLELELIREGKLLTTTKAGVP
jgi:hypothetical protein